MLKIPYQKLRLSSKGNLNLTTSSISNNNSKSNSTYSTKTINGSNATNNSTNSTFYRISRRVLQGIPVLSIFAFLGILSMMISLDSSGLVGLDISNKAYAEEPITPYATTASASLSIGGAGETEQVAAGRGVVTYRAHTVTLNASNIESYTLTIAGNTNMTGAGTVSGAKNTTGTNMLDNTWGYSYGETTTQDKMTYKALSTTGTTIESGTPATNTITNQTKNLVFAVKFGEDIPQGRYYTNVKLSLTASPAILTTYSVTYDCNGGTGCPSNYSESSYDESKTYTIPFTSTNNPTKAGYNFLGYSTNSAATTADSNYAPGKSITLTQASSTRALYVVWEEAGPSVTGFGGIKRMQDMTATICKSVSIGTSGELYDIRDNSTYTVKKLNSEQCWMTQNLRIVNKTISSADSDMDSGSFTVPASSTSGFSDNTASNAYYPNDTTKGAYYTWCAATAGSCSSATTAGTNASASICPKNWHLPVGGGPGTSDTNTGATSDTKNDFMVMTGKTSTNSFTDASLVSGTNITLSTTTWPFAGLYDDSAPGSVDTDGYYWSRTTNSSAIAYALYVDNGGYVSLANRLNRCFGFSVRCVAYSN